MYLTAIISTLAATTIMTIFSYIVARIFKQPYKEPYLIAVLISYLDVTDNITPRILGWIIHYMIGFLFVALFEVFFQGGWVAVNWVNALLYGTVIGIMGIISWNIIFSLSERKPIMDYHGYYVQLFIAHLIFGFVVVYSHMVQY